MTFSPSADEDRRLIQGIEALLMVVEEPLAATRIGDQLGIPAERAEVLLRRLAVEYDGGESGVEPRGFELRQAAGGWRIYARAQFHPLLEEFITDGHSAKLSGAALETLAVVAYRQPVSRARIAAVRGVSVDGVVRTLVTRGLITETDTDALTGAHLYGTTPLFEELLGLNSLDELPDLAPFLPDAGESAVLGEL